jgi:hypothetical protein
MAIDLTALTAAVAQAETVEASAVEMINGFVTQVKSAVEAALAADASADEASNAAAQAAIDEVQARVLSSSSKLAAAITANTPSEVPPA